MVNILLGIIVFLIVMIPFSIYIFKRKYCAYGECELLPKGEGDDEDYVYLTVLATAEELKTKKYIIFNIIKK